MDNHINKNSLKITSIAHEIRQPLSAITMLANLSIDDFDGKAEDGANEEKDILSNLKEIINQAQRCSHIMEKMSNENKLYQTEFKTLCINPLINQVLQELKYNEKAKKITVKYNLQNHLPAIKADEEALHQLLSNLVKNAVDAMQSSPHKILTVRSFRVNNGIQLEVMDTGYGIEPADNKRIFQSYYTTKGHKGTGIGLSICETIVKSHNGNITVNSKVNRGSCFKVFLPFNNMENRDKEMSMIVAHDEQKDRNGYV